jgi:predicted enzyme related to lactoylglutathione lyase
MKIKNISLAWVSTTDLKQAKNFFSDILGLKVSTASDEHGWLELHAKNDDFLLGVGEVKAEHDHSSFAATTQINPVKPGQNAVITFEVPNIELAKIELESKNVRVYDIVTIPGHVKMAFLQDFDGNFFQLVELLD